MRDVADEGKNLITPTQHNLIKLGNIANGYRIPAMRYEAWSVLTNKCPSGANRGIGKPFMCFAIERAMALLARRLGLDPAELRLRNYVTADADALHHAARRAVRQRRLPGDAAPRARAVRLRGLARRAGARRASEGRLLGIGIATSVEPAGTNLASYEIITGRRAASGSAEAAMVRMEPDGQVRVSSATRPSGQGYETVIAQIVADELGLTPDASHGRPRLRLGDHALALSLGQLLEQVLGHRRGRGRGRGRAACADKLLRIAAHRLESDASPISSCATARSRCAARRTGGSPSRSWRAPPTPTCSACRRARSRASRPATRTQNPLAPADRRASAACAPSSSSPTPRTAAWSRWTRAPAS